MDSWKRKWENEVKTIFEDTKAKTILQLRKDINADIQEPQWISNIGNKIKSIPRVTVIKLQEITDKKLKSIVKRKHIIFNEFQWDWQLSTLEWQWKPEGSGITSTEILLT